MASAVDVLITWIVKTIESALSKIFAPLMNAIDSYIQMLNRTFIGAFESFLEGGDISEEWAKNLTEVLFGLIFSILMAIGIALVALQYVIAALTMGMGTIVMNVVVPLIVSVIVTSILRLSAEAGALPFQLPTVEGLNWTLILGIIGAILGVGSGVSSNTRYSKFVEILNNNVALVLAFLAKVISISRQYIILYFVAAKMDETGSAALGFSFFMIILAFMFNIASLSVLGINGTGGISPSLVFTCFALFCAMIGWVFRWIAQKSIGSKIFTRSMSIILWTLLVISFLLSIASYYLLLG